MKRDLEFVVRETRRELKEKNKKDAAAWVAVRTALEVVQPDLGGMSVRLEPLVKRLKPELTGSLLDVGCQGGWLYAKVRDRVHYTGIDNFAEAIRSASLLFGNHFECCELKDYKTQHDIVWATQLHPETHPPSVFDHLKGLSKKMLVVTFAKETDVIPGGEVIPMPDWIAVVYRW